MDNGHGYQYPSGYKLKLSDEERKRRAEQILENGKPSFKLTQAGADKVLELLKTNSGAKVATMTGFSKPTISRIKNGKHRTAYPKV
jgi:hypothetical protein